MDRLRQREAIRTALTGIAPLLIQVGGDEVLLDDAVRLAARAAADNVEVTLEVSPGLTHVFQNYFGQLADADEALTRTATFLTSKLPTHDETPSR